MRIALVQQPAVRSLPEANLSRAVDICEQAAEQEADLVVFPELWQIGYAPCPAPEAPRRRWMDQAIDETSTWIKTLRAAAARLDLALVATYLRAQPGGVGNAAALVDRRGHLAGVYTKVHTTAFTWERFLQPGRSFTVTPVDTRAGVVAVGTLICFDREFPEASRALALDGAELIICPNACLLCDDRVGQVRTRAFENMAAVAVANYPLPRMNGRSCAFDGRAVESNGRPRDHRIATAGAGPALLLADLDLDALRAYRTGPYGIWGGRHRKPASYGLLTRDDGTGGPAPADRPRPHTGGVLS